MSELTDARESEPQKPERVENVGETFMAWAEKGWGLERIITKGMTTDDGAESCPYDYMRAAFVEKINELNELNKIE